jgi:ADP-ribose pyrophosphatase
MAIGVWPEGPTKDPTVPDPALTGSRSLFVSDRFALAAERWSTVDGEVERPVIHHPGAVAILAQPDPHSVVLVRQFRYPVRRWILEIPAGTRIPGEHPQATAERELREEAGLSACSFVEILRFLPAVGVSDEELIVYRATGLSEVAAAPEPGELVGREVVSLADLPRRWRAGDICDAKTIIACQLLGVDILSPRAQIGEETQG